MPGKSYIIRKVGSEVYENFVEINFVEDDEGPGLFKNVHTIQDFYLALSSLGGEKLRDYKNTLVFIDEIQHYPQYLTLLKFLREDHRYHFIGSGSLLGITLNKTTSIPIGSILVKEMFPLDFEEFLIANGMGMDAVGHIREKFIKKTSLDERLHEYVMGLFRRYLLTLTDF